MIINWFKMKSLEIKYKLAFYIAISKALGEMDDIVKLIYNLYAALKNTPVEELQDKLIGSIAELAHAQAVKEREAVNKTHG